MEIKFWCKRHNEYLDDEVYYIDEDGGVYSFNDRCYENFMQDEGHIEPHFYLNGERVA